MRSLRAVASIMFLIPLLVACQGAGTLLPQLDGGAAGLRSASAIRGLLVAPGDKIPVEIDESPRPERLRLSLYAVVDTDRRSPLAQVDVPAGELAAGTISPFTMPPVPDGAYRLVSRSTYAGRPELVGETVLFCSRGTWAIQSLATYPGTLSAGGDALVELAAEVPGDAEPWVRWSMGGKVVKTGPLTDGRQKVSLKLPEAEGIYSCMVEIFPEAPFDGVDFDFKAPLSREVRLLVGASPAKSDPAGDYRYRFRFNGTLVDNGAAAAAGSALRLKVTGDRLFDLSSGMVGYRLGAGTAFAAERGVLPDFRQPFAPFSLGLRFQLLDRSEVLLVGAAPVAGAPGFQLTADSKGTLSLVVGDAPAVVLVDRLETLRAIDLSLCFSRMENGLHVVASTSDSLAASRVVPLAALRPASVRGGGSVLVPVLGGTGGGAFLVDNFDLYQPAGADDAFYVAMHRRFGAALRFAQDLAIGAVPRGLEAEGDVRVDAAGLLMGAGGSLRLPEVGVEGQKIKLVFSFAAPNADQASSFAIAAPGMETVRIGFNGVISQGERVKAIDGMSIQPLRFELVPSQDGYSVVAESVVFPVRGLKSGASITCTLARDAKASAVPLVVLNIVRVDEEVDQGDDAL